VTIRPVGEESLDFLFIIYQLLCDYQTCRRGKPGLSLQTFIPSSNLFLPRVVNFTSTFLIATSRLSVNMTNLSYVAMFCLHYKYRLTLTTIQKNIHSNVLCYTSATKNGRKTMLNLLWHANNPAHSKQNDANRGNVISQMPFSLTVFISDSLNFIFN
jgi:hypothetical protein